MASMVILYLTIIMVIMLFCYHILMTLLFMEMMMLIMFFIMMNNLNFYGDSLHTLMAFLSMNVCEGGLGMSILIAFVRGTGNNKHMTYSLFEW